MYASATLYVRVGADGDWAKETGTHERLLQRFNGLGEAFGPPSSTQLLECEHTDIAVAKWGEAIFARYVMHKLPPHVTLYCPTCRQEVKPPEYGQVGIHGWEFNWRLDDGVYLCDSVILNEEVHQCGQPVRSTS